MTGRSPSLFLLLLLLLVSSGLHAQSPWVPGEVLVRLSPDTRWQTVQQGVVERLPEGVQLRSFTPLGKRARYGKLVVAGTQVTMEHLQQLVAGVPGVDAVSPNYRLNKLAVPNDTEYATQWNLGDIQVEQVWDHTTGGAMANGERIAVAISDDAVETVHPDMLDNIWPGSPHQGGGSFHGTAVASVVGAVGNNGLGIAGVNWDVDIVSIAQTPDGDLSDAILVFEESLALRQQFNASNGASGALVVSMTASWVVNGVVPCDGFSEPLFHDLALSGILVVTGGPNLPAIDLDTSPNFPSSCALAEHVVVSSIGPLGETPFSFGNSSVHLLAPGLQIPVADDLGSFVVDEGNSFAIPHVAGAIALLYSVPCDGFAQLVMDDPVAARELVKAAVLENTTAVPGGAAVCITGGKLNVHAAYQALMAQCSSLVCNTLTVDLTTPAGGTGQYVLTDGTGSVVEQGTGASFAFCGSDGCYTVDVTDAGSAPLNGTFTVTDTTNTVIASGTILNGELSFTVGTPVQGCTDPNALNYDPTAVCDDGSCCPAGLIQVAILTDALGLTGTVDVTVTLGGTVIQDGPMPIEDLQSFGVSGALITFCEAPGCLSVTVGNSDVPLAELSLISFISQQDFQ